jgi:RHS repeat-associated protein
VTDHYTYDAFGNQLVAVGATPNVNRYVGEAFDAALQMTYLRARYMNPGSGRFWTADAAQGNRFDPPSLHRYLYAAADPVNEFDPLGLATMEQGKVVELWVGMDFMSDGYYSHMFSRMSGAVLQAGRISIAKILGLTNNFPGGRRFPDLIDWEHHFIFEVKPGFPAGLADVAYYLAVLNASDPWANWRAGDIRDFFPFPIVPCDTTLTCIAFVHPPGGGVITYDTWNLRPALLTIAVLASIGIASFVALSLLAPYLAALAGLVADMGAAAALWGAGLAGELAMVGGQQPAFGH